MTIFLPIQLKKTGGTSTFARKFQKGMESHGHSVTFTHTSNYDVLLVSPRCPFRYVLEAKIKGKRIVHRLDGVYYPSTIAGWQYPLYNLPLRIIRNYFADYIVYQSKYSKHTCNRFLGKEPDTPSTIIYNGVDTKRFSPNGPKKQLKDNPDQHVFITASRFRRADQIIPILKAFNEYQQTYTHNSKLVIIGDVQERIQTIIEPFTSNTSIEWIGAIDNKTLPQYLRAADVFVFTHQNPPCPNNVIEAMACWLPICGVADGAMPELVEQEGNGLLLPTTSDGFNTPRSLNQKLFAENMRKCLSIAQQQAIKIPKIYALTHMIDAYNNILANTEKPT